MSTEVKTHGERAHALLSASGASRWLNCPPSARLEEQFPDKTSSHADEGTLAHELAEIKLRSLYKLARQEKSTEEETKKRREAVARIKESQYYNQEMEEATDLYCAYVMEQYNEAISRSSAAILFIEAKVSLESYIEEGFGTCDAIVVSGDTMDVIDLKYGKGVRVSADENTQLKLYGLGALEEYGFLYNVENIRLHIIQPRLDATSTFEITDSDLTKWGKNFVRPRAAMAFAGEGEQASGEWCRFCKVKTHCRKLHDETMEIARNQFPDVRLLTDEAVLEAYKVSDKITKWLTAIREYIFNEALLGRSWEGFKLVEGRSVRQLKDVEAVENKLRSEGYTEADFMTMKMKGLGDLEKLLGKQGFEEILGNLVTKPSGKPTLVPASDKRKEINTSASAAEAFDDIV
jgi:hypothetical protein